MMRFVIGWSRFESGATDKNLVEKTTATKNTGRELKFL